MKNLVKFEKAFNYFKESYDYKMGGTQTVVLPNGKEKFFDDRKYYSGRGSKYNSSVRHDEKGIVKVSKSEYSKFLKQLKEQELRMQEKERRTNDKACRIEDAKKRGVYSFEGFTNSEKGAYVELSNEEITNKTFDAERLANTLGVLVEDIELLNSIGKTYVFARSYKTGETFKLYHPSLECNPLTIHVQIADAAEIAKFNHSEWFSAPFSKKLGMTSNQNHFVC